MEKQKITVAATIASSLENVWQKWTDPEHIIGWNYASDDWHTPHATNDLRIGGTFSSRMEAKDGSMGFDFGGTYTLVEHLKTIEYVLDDDRVVQITFSEENGQVTVTETFETEDENSAELQRNGWQAIMNHFKQYVESHS